VRRGSKGQTARPLAGGLLLGTLLSLTLTAGCASSRRAAARFSPASDVQAREALDAWSAIRRRTDALPPSRLLYDAKMSGKAAPAVPGTLAVTYDGSDVTRASLAGPFGKTVAEYANGTITGGGKEPFPVDPRVLRSVLAGTWPTDPARVEGCEGAECLLAFEGPIRAAAVVDRAAVRLVSLRVTGDAGVLSATYGGVAPSNWPDAVAIEQEGAARRISLRLVAAEPLTPAAGGPGS
jgi:hypothetical protein